MNAIQEIKDENVRKVAQTLRSSGLASSESEAVRMAMMMTKTSQRVTQNFEQKREGATMGQSHLHKEIPIQAELHSTNSLFNTGNNTSHNNLSHNSSSATLNSMFNADVNVASSVQDKPRKYEEKEEFIFGDVQQQTPVQKKDPYTMNNEFEEIVAQDLVGTKRISDPVAIVHHESIVQEAKINQAPVNVAVKPTAFVSSKPMAFASSKPFSTMPNAIRADPTQIVHTPVNQVAPIEAKHEVKAPISAQASSQNAFSILLGSAKTNPHYEEEVKHGEEQAIKVQEAKIEAKVPEVRVEVPTAVMPSPVAGNPRPLVATVSPQKKMMMEANVDLSKMFSFNK